MAKKTRKFTIPVYLTKGRGAEYSSRKVLCDRQSVTQNEFMSADKSQGIKPKYCMVCRAAEYKGEKSCRYKDINYSIYRTYDCADGVVELYLTPKAGEQI